MVGRSSEASRYLLVHAGWSGTACPWQPGIRHALAEPLSTGALRSQDARHGLNSPDYFPLREKRFQAQVEMLPVKGSIRAR